MKDIYLRKYKDVLFMKGIRNRQLPYYLITIALFIGLAGPFLVGEGMFMDGLLYSVISNNLAHGNGTFGIFI
jgi:hypothetical protein